MHLHARYTGADLLMEATAAPPFGPGFTVSQVADADTLEVWVTSLAYIADTTVWRLVRDGTVVAVSEVGGL
jgi:hypothetical protein